MDDSNSKFKSKAIELLEITYKVVLIITAVFHFL
jgi:hypothetical protein